MARDANGKLTYEMKSPGQAFQDYLEKHHNVSAFTPAWLDSKNHNPSISAIDKRVKELEKWMDNANEQQALKNEQKPEKKKDVGMAR